MVPLQHVRQAGLVTSGQKTASVTVYRFVRATFEIMNLGTFKFVEVNVKINEFLIIRKQI